MWYIVYEFHCLLMAFRRVVSSLSSAINSFGAWATDIVGLTQVGIYIIHSAALARSGRSVCTPRMCPSGISLNFIDEALSIADYN